VAKPAVRPKPRVATKPRPEAGRSKHAAERHRPSRPQAFFVPGAPKEPRDEMSLPARARQLGSWLSTHRRPTNANLRAYLYQHSWIVTGAKFGWWRGAEALRILVRVDRRAEKLWDAGPRSRLVALAAMRVVEARSR
jgi:hypothetical protein